MGVLIGTHVALTKTGIVYTPASSGFAAIAEKSQQAEAVLVTLDLRAKGAQPALTVRIGDREWTDADGNRYDALLLAKTSMDSGGEYLESGFQPVDLDLVIGDGHLGQQAPGQRVSTLLWLYDLTGTAVTVRLGSSTLAVADYPVIFEGEVAEVTDVAPTEVTLRCVQDRKWVAPLPTKKVEKNTYPDAPTDSVGMPVPLFLGNFSAGRVLMSDLPSPANKAAYKAGVARAPIPMVPIDGGTSSNQPKFLISSAAVASDLEYILCLDRTTGLLMGSVYCTNATDAQGNKTMTLTGANFSKFDLAILGADADPANECPDWLETSRADKDYTLSGAALLDYDLAKTKLRVMLPDIPVLGTLKAATVLCWYAKNASVTTHPRFGLEHSVNGDVYFDLDAAASDIYPSDTPRDYDSVDVSAKITTWEDIKNGVLVAEVREAKSKLQVHRLVLLLTFIPAMSVIKTGATRQERGETYTVSGRKDRGYTASHARFSSWRTIKAPDILSFDAPAYTYQRGPEDDGSGTYTGTAGAQIEHPADCAHWLLANYPGEGANAITTAAATHGSFADIRTALPGYKAQVYISEATDTEDVVAEIGRQFLIWFHRRHHALTSPWVAIPWDVGVAANYKSTSNVFVFTKRYVEGIPKLDLTPVSQVRNVVRVNYDYDLRTKTYAEQAFVSESDSRGWDSIAGAETRDQTALREPLAALSQSLYGKREHVINLSMTNDPATAASVRDRAFDLMYKPRVVVRFTTFLNAFDLERGMVIQLSEEFDSIMPCPIAGLDGSWYGKNFRVLRVTRREAGATTHDIEAVEV